MALKFMPNIPAINDNGIKILDIMVSVFIILLAWIFCTALQVSATIEIFS